MIQKRLLLSKKEIDEYSLDVSRKVKELACYKEAKIIGVYQPIKQEIEIYGMLSTLSIRETV